MANEADAYYTRQAENISRVIETTHAAEEQRKERLYAAQSLLDEADGVVSNMEHNLAGKGNDAGTRRMWRARLDLWKKVQSLAAREVVKHGGAT